MRKIAVSIFLSSLIAVLFLQIQTASAASLSLNNEETKAVDMLTQQIKQKLKRGTYFLLGVDTQLKNSREELVLLRKNMRALKNKIVESNAKITDLNSQLENLDRFMAQNEEKIRAIRVQIAEQENAALLLASDIREQKKILQEDIKNFSNALGTYYFQTNAFFDVNEPQGNLLAFLASDQSTGEVLKEQGYLFFLQQATQDLASRIEEEQKNLDEKQNQLELKNQITKELQILLKSEKRMLSETQASKKRLLEETKGRQAIYETLLELSKKEEEQVALQIERLKENYAFFQTKLDELKNNPAAREISFQTFDLDLDDASILKGEAPLAWPVSPSLGLTALFRDEEYKKALGIAHNAIDIRLTQGSKVKAAADGVVTKVADNGFAYSYIIVAHPDGILTLYGHVSEMLVSEGEIVRQGQTIALSGGTPGTKGAGWLTTGAHLHFEVFKNWQHVDPLEYLPLEFVPVASLPEKYLKRLQGETEEKIRRK